MKKFFTVLLIVFISGVGFSQSISRHSERLTDNWQFIKQDLGGVWEAVRPARPGRPETVPIWTDVTQPHCFNTTDAVNPDVNYYQGPGWYRTALQINNPYKNGRTLLHFEGAGQKTEVYIALKKVGKELGWEGRGRTAGAVVRPGVEGGPPGRWSDR